MEGRAAILTDVLPVYPHDGKSGKSRANEGGNLGWRQVNKALVTPDDLSVQTGNPAATK